MVDGTSTGNIDIRTEPIDIACVFGSQLEEERREQRKEQERTQHVLYGMVYGMVW